MLKIYIMYKYNSLLVAIAKIIFSITCFVLIMIVVSCPSNAKIGYNLDIDVEGTRWSKSNAAEHVSFEFDGSCVGDGRSYKHVKLGGFMGIGLEESTYAKEGRLDRTDKISLDSGGDSCGFKITEIVSDSSNHYNCYIDEYFPIILYAESVLHYRGDGINSKNIYGGGNVNRSKIYTNYHGDRLSKTVRSVAVAGNSKFSVDIVPGNVTEKYHVTSSAAGFSMSSFSDQYSEFGFRANGAQVENIYLGKFNIKSKMTLPYEIMEYPNCEPWLKCCLSENDPTHVIFNPVDEAFDE